MPQHGTGDLVYVGVPCLAALFLLVTAGYRAIRSRQWLFVIPAILSGCTILYLVGLWFDPRLPGSVCPGAIGVIAFAIFLHVAIIWATRSPAVPPAAPQPPANSGTSNPS